MSHNQFDQFNDLVTRLAAADGTVAEAHSQEILDTALDREVLEAIVGGVRNHFRLSIGGKEAIGQFRECSGLDSEQEIVE